MIFSTLYNILLKKQTHRAIYVLCLLSLLFLHSGKAIAANKSRKQKSSSTVSESIEIRSKKNSTKSIQPKATVETLSANAQCFSGNNFSFTSSSSISTGSIATEFWDFGDGKTGTGTSVSHSYFLPGTYSVKLIVTSDKGCVDSLSHSVTVYPQPQASYIIPSGQCLAGNNFNFISNATIGFGGSISSQSWNFGDGNVATGNNSSHSFSIDGKYPVNLQVTSTDGCTDIITDTITVYQMPILTASAVSPVCSGSTINLNSVVSGGTTPYQYIWTGPNGFTATQANPTIPNASTNASGNYSVILSDSNGCSASASANLVVNLTPAVAPISGPLGGCVGSTIILSNTTANGIWSSHNNSVATVNATSGQVSFLSTGSVLIDYTVTNATCTTTVSSTLFSNSVTLHPDIIECNNGITHFNATDPYYGVTYSNNNAGNTYVWTISGGPYSYQGSSTATSKFVDLQLQTGNAFTIRVQFTSNSVSCIAQQIVYKNTTSADSIQGSHDTTVCNNSNSIPLSGVVSAATNSFQWTSSGTGSFSNSLALHTNYSPSAADKLAGIVKIYFTATTNLNSTGNCGSSYGKDSMVLRIYPANMSSNANQVICSNQNINFSPVSSIPGSFYSWSSSVVAGSANGNSATGTGNINDSLVNNSNSLDAQVVYNITPFAFTPTNITCIGNPFNYTVLIKPNPKATITNNATSICTGTNTNIQFNSSIVGSTYTWSSTVINGGATVNSTNNIASTNNTIQDQLTNGYNVNSNVRYYIHTVSSSGCNNIDSTDVLVYALPTTANAGLDQTLCNVTSSVLSANIPGIGTGKWDMISGPSTVTFGTPSSAFSTVTGLVPGIYQFTWSITNGSCIVSKDTIQLINAAASIGGSIHSNAAVCIGQNSGTLTLTGYSGVIKSWESSTDGGITWLLIINDTSNTYTFNNLNSTTLFRANIQSGNCIVAKASPATVIVNNNSVPGVLVSDTAVCISSNSGSLYLNNNNGSILRWESSIDNGSSWQNINNTSNTFSFTNLTTTTLYRALTQNGACNNAYSNIVNVKVNPTSIAGILGTNAIVCSNNNNGSVTLTGNTGKIIAWEASINNGNSWSTISDSTNSISYNNLTTTTNYRASIQSGNCPIVLSNISTITVLQNVSASNAGADQALCNQTTTTLTANTPTSGTGSWTALAGNPTAVSFSNANDPSPIVSGLIPGTYQFVWTISNTLCTDSKDTVQIIVYPPTIAGTLTASAVVCANNNANTLALTGSIGNILAWESSTNNGTSWNTIANNNSTYTYNNLNTSTAFRTLVQNQICPSAYSNVVNITVLQAATIANAGADQVLCNQTTASLDANTANSGTGTWTALASNPSSVSFTNNIDPHTTVTGLSAGTYQFVWTISNSLCADSKDTVQIIVYPPTIAGTLTASAVVCANNNANTLALTNSTGIILAWESSTNNGTSWNTIANNNSTYTDNNLNTSTAFRALVQNQICPSAYSNVVNITVLQAATIANAGTDQALCNQTSSKLDANTAISGTGTWTALVSNPSSVSFTNIIDPHTTVTGLNAGTYQFVWTISNTLCADSKDTVQILVNPPTNPGVLSSDATVCANSNNGTLSLNGYLNTIEHWESSINGTNWNTIANTTSKLNYSNLTNSMYYRVSVINGNCPSSFSNTVSISVLPAATIADAGPDTTLINGFSSYRLLGNIPSSGTGVWSVLPPLGPSNLIFTDTSDANATIHPLTFHYADSTTTPITPPSDGIYYLKWTISNGICPASESAMVVTVQPPTNPGFVGQDTVICSGVNHGIVNLKGYFGEILQWEDSTANSSGWQIIPRTIGADQDTIHFENLTTTTMYRALVKNGVGLSLYSGIAATITVLDAVSIADAGTDSSICNTTSVQLWGNTPIIGTGTWSYVPNGTALVAPSFSNKKDPRTIVTGLSIGTYQFVWTISNGSCNNSTDTVNITINAPTETGTLITSNVVCANNNYGVLHLSGYKGSVLQSSYSTDNGTNWISLSNSSNMDSIIYTNLSASTEYRMEVKNGVCPALLSNIVSVTVLLNVSNANAGSDQYLCNQTSTTLTASAPISGTGIWSSIPSNPSPVNFSNINDPNSTVNGLLAGNYLFVWTVSNNLCADSKDTMQVIVHPPTIAGTLSADAIVCANNNASTLTLIGATGTVLAWEYSNNSGSSWVTIANTDSTYSYNNLNSSTSYRALVQNKICPSAYSNIVNIAVLQNATIPNAGTDQILCNQSTTTLDANTAISGTGNWTAFATNPSLVNFSNANDPKSTVLGLNTGTYQFVWTITNSNCVDSKDTVQITVHPPTIAGTLSADAIVCANYNANTLILTGATGTILAWEYSINSGSSWIAIANTDATYSYNNLNNATSYRALVQNKICPSAYSNIVNIAVLQNATIADAGTDQMLCNQSSLILKANTPTSGTGNWTALATNSSTTVFANSSDPNTTVSGLIAGTYQFVWTITNSNCADSKDTVQITTYDALKAGSLIADNFVCADANSGDLTLSNFVGNIVQWESSIDNGVNWNILPIANNSYHYSNLSTSTMFRVLVANGPCNSAYSNLVSITVNPVTQPGILSTSDSLVCDSYNAGKLSLTGYTGAIIHWETSIDNGVNWTIIHETNNTYDFNNIHSATLYRVLIQSGVCNTSYSNTIQVATSSATIAGTISGNATVCYNNNSGNLSLSGNSGNILHWESSIDNGVSWSIIADTNRITTYNLLTTTTIYRALIQNAICAIEYTNSVKIDVVQPVTIANAGPDQVICNATSSTFLHANQAISGEGVWTIVSGGSDIYFDDATSATTKVNGLLPGTYQFSWKIDNGICAASSSIVNIVVDKTKADFSLSAINDCGSTTYQFVDASTSVFGIANWKWSSATGDTSTNIKKYSKVYSQPGQNKISLTVQSNTGCTNTTGASYQVKVFFIPKANINAINEACKNELLQLTSTLSSRDSINAILWNLGNGINTKDSSTTVQYYSEGKYTIKLLVSTVNKCYDSTIKDIAIHPLPVVTIPANQIACKGDTLKLLATGALNYIWKDQQNNIVCNGCAVYSYLPSVNNSISVIGYNQYGCSQIASTNIKVIQPIKIAAKLLDTLCQGTSIRLKVTGADTYAWLPDPGLNNYKIANPIAAPLVTTTYTVIGKENYACFADTAKIRLVVGTPTAFNIGTDTTIQSGVPFKLLATSNELQNIRSWQWSGNADFACSNCASTMAKVVFDGNIQLRATNIYGCMSTDTISIKTFCPNSEIFIPNAFTPDADGINDILFVQGSGIKLIKSFKIYSRWGELVFERTNFQPGDKSNGWDGKVRGKPASQDVFVYICEALCEKGIPATFKGNIALLK